ncbi:MAG: hypothetical protein ABWY04_06125 [Arthrobacter sp.]
MTELSRPTDPCGYRLCVSGHLPDSWGPWFEGLTLTRDEDGTTILCGAVPDQAALHGVLARIRDLGVPLISVEAIYTPHP